MVTNNQTILNNIHNETALMDDSQTLSIQESVNLCISITNSTTAPIQQAKVSTIMNFHANNTETQYQHSFINTPSYSRDSLFVLHSSKKRKTLNHIMNNITPLYWINPHQGPLPQPIPPSYQEHGIHPSIPINFGLQLLFSPSLAFSTALTPIHQYLPLHSTNIHCNNSITAIRDIIHQTNIVTKENPPNRLQASVLSQYFQTNEIQDAAIVIQLAQTLIWNRVLPMFVMEKDEYKSQRPQLTIKAVTINILTSLCYYFANDCHKMSCNRNNTTIETCKHNIKKQRMKRMANFFIHHYGRLSLGSPWELRIAEQDILTRNYNSVVDFFNRKSKQGMFSIRYLADVHYHDKVINGNVIKGLTIHHWQIITSIYYNLGVNKNKLYLLSDEQSAITIPTTDDSIHQGDPDTILQQYEEYYRDATAEVERCFHLHNQNETNTQQTFNITDNEPINKTAV